MKKEDGKYTIYSNCSTAITAINKETDHFITALLKSDVIVFYSDTTISKFSEKLEINATSTIAFIDGNFIVKTDLPNYELTYSFANHSDRYDQMMKEFNELPKGSIVNLSIADYECKMSPQPILYTKNNDVYKYGMIELLIQKDKDKFYIIANMEKYTYQNESDRIVSGIVEITPDQVNKLRPIFAYPSVGTVIEGNNRNIIEIKIFMHNDNNSPIDEGNYVELNLSYIKTRIYY